MKNLTPTCDPRERLTAPIGVASSAGLAGVNFPVSLSKQQTKNDNNRNNKTMRAAVSYGSVLSRKNQPEIEVERTYSRPALEGGRRENLSWVGTDRGERSPERIAKAIARFEQIALWRKDKSRCPRCGQARGEQYRTCDRCREKIRKAKLRAKGVAVLKGGEYSNADLAAMVLQMRREMDKMQARFKLWQKAANYRRNLHYRTNTMRKKYLKPVSHAEAMDYLAETNHAYDNDET